MVVGNVVVLVDGSGAERGDLDDLAAESHVREAETPADQATVAEQRAHLVGRRIGRHVEVLGMQARCMASRTQPPTRKAW